MTDKIGVIAEDKSDVAVVRKIIEKRINPSDFSLKQFVGHGCGPIPKKCIGWAQNLWARGCRHLILLHDLDTKDRAELEASLKSLISRTAFASSVVVIPVREIEAWMLADAAALQSVFGLRLPPRLVADTESVEDPKRYLKTKIMQVGKKNYLHTVHNEKIAEAARLSKLRLCPSFVVLDNFVKKIIQKLT